LDFNGAGQLQARYLSVPGAIDELLARQTASGVAWYLDDRLGSVKDIIDNTGTVLDHIDYTAYGQATESAPPQGDRFKYAGMEFDAAISLYYDRARYYDPAAGRFITNDLSEFDGEDDNLYRYVGSNPPNYHDTTGLAKDLPTLKIDEVGKIKGGENTTDKLLKINKADVDEDCAGAANLLNQLFISIKQRIKENNAGKDDFKAGHQDEINRELRAYNQLLDNFINSKCGGGKGKGPSSPYPQPEQPRQPGPSMRARLPTDTPYDPYQGIPPWFLKEYGIPSPGSPGIVTQPGRNPGQRIPRVPIRTTPISPRVPVRATGR